MSNFKTIKVKEIGKVITGNTPPTVSREYYGAEYTFIKPTDMRVGERYVFETEERLSEIAFKKYSKSLIPPLSTCVVTIGSLGKKLCLTRDYCFTNQAVNAVIPNEQYDNNFVYYLFKYINPAIENLSNGTASGRDNVSKSSFENLNIVVPKTKAYQQSLASFLTPLDDLIEINNQRIKILEEMASQLYKEWFVRMRFKGYKETKFKKGVPENWMPVKVGKLIHRIAAGKRYDSKSALEQGAVPIIDQGASGILGYHNDEPGVLASEEKPVIIFTNHTCYQRLIQFPFSSIQNVLPFISSIDRNYNRNIYWLFYATRGIVELNEYKGHFPEFISKEIYMPEKELCDEFGRIIQPMVKSIYLIESQNNELLHIRDRLLPHLISGKLQIKTVNKTSALQD